MSTCRHFQKKRPGRWQNVVKLLLLLTPAANRSFSFEQPLAFADKTRYRSNNEGPNRVTIYQHSTLAQSWRDPSQSSCYALVAEFT
jgi:hypothetical protein